MFFKHIAASIQARLRLSLFLPLLCVALLTTWYGLFWSVEYFSSLTGGLRFVDMQPTLTVDALFTQIRTYDNQTTVFYLWWLVFDYAWPFLTFTTMLFIAGWLFQYVDAGWSRCFPWLVGFAYMTVLMDWAENSGFSALVLLRPVEPLWLAQITLALHAAKLTFNMLFNLGFWVLLAAVLGKGVVALARRAF